jgi:acyl carrier protein
MPDLESRMAQCFAQVFPRLAPNRVQQATMETVTDWDSLHTVTLVAVLEEEFSVDISADDIPTLISFAAIREFLDRIYQNG